MITELEYIEAKRIVEEYENQTQPTVIEKIYLDKLEGDIQYIEDLDTLLKACEEISNNVNVEDNSKIIKRIMECELNEMDYLPSCSFGKGQPEPDHSNWEGHLYLPSNVCFSFGVCEGDAVEISWDHSIYETDIVDWKLIK